MGGRRCLSMTWRPGADSAIRPSKGTAVRRLTSLKFNCNTRRRSHLPASTLGTRTPIITKREFTENSHNGIPLEGTGQWSNSEQAGASSGSDAGSVNPVKAAFYRRAAGVAPFQQEKEPLEPEVKKIGEGNPCSAPDSSPMNRMKAAFHRRAAGLPLFKQGNAPEDTLTEEAGSIAQQEFEDGTNESRTGTKKAGTPVTRSFNPMKAAFHRRAAGLPRFKQEITLKVSARRAITANRVKRVKSQRPALLSRIIQRKPAAVTEVNPLLQRERTRKRIRDMEAELSFLSHDIFSEYFRWRHGDIEGRISQHASAIRLLAFEFCQIRLGHITNSLSRLASEINEGFVQPRLSARRKIDQLLHYRDEETRVYDTLKGMTSEVSHNLTYIRRLHRDIVMAVPPRSRIRKSLIDIGRALTIHHVYFQRTAHGYRGGVLERLQFTGPLSDAYHVKDLLVRQGLQTRAVYHKDVLKTLEHIYRTGGKLENHPNIFPPIRARVLRDFYVPLLVNAQTSCDPDSEIHLRQLDMMAPFDLITQRLMTIINEIEYLFVSLDESLGLFSKLDLFDRQYYRHMFKISGQQLRGEYRNLSVLTRDLLVINWIRLKTEHKLHVLGELDWNERNRPFSILNPISQNIPRFHKWVDIMNGEYWQQRILTSATKPHLHQAITAERSVDKDGEVYDQWIRNSFALGKLDVGVMGSKRRKQFTPPSLPSGQYVEGPFQPLRSQMVVSRPYAVTSRSYTSKSTRRPLIDDEVGENNSANRDLPNLGIQQTMFNDQPQATTLEEAVMGQQKVGATETEAEATEANPAKPAASTAPQQFWSHRLHNGPDGKPIPVHYCTSLQTTEQVAQRFLHDQILGFDMEWKAQATSHDTIQSNLSLIQLASNTRIALFHVALFRPFTSLTHLVSPTLQTIMESPHITKVGVNIKADCTRLRKYLGIDARAIFELSHLHKLIKYCDTTPQLVNKRPVTLSQQVEEHFGLPLLKESGVRCSDWTRKLNYEQVQYAAADPFAGVSLFHAMDGKRKTLVPVPPLPAHAELNLPIRVVEREEGVVVGKNENERVVTVTEATLDPAAEDNGESST